MDSRDRLRAAGRRFRRAEKALDAARTEVNEAIVAALHDGVRPFEAASLSTLAPSHVRKVARENGIGPSPQGLHPTD